MKHLCINTDNNIKRKQFMENQFNNSKVENIRISAITPLMFDDILEQKRPLSCKHPGCTSCEYEYACISSHIKAMKECLKYTDEYFVIMEDDIFIPFDINYKDLLKNVNTDIDIIQMMVLYDKTVLNLYSFYEISNINYIKWKYLLPSTGMYIISKKGAQKLVDKFINKNNKYDFSSSEFQIVADVLLYSTVNTICMTLPYCYPYIEMGSEIHPDHLQAHSKAINAIKYVINNRKDYPFIKKTFKLI